MFGESICFLSASLHSFIKIVLKINIAMERTFVQTRTWYFYTSFYQIAMDLEAIFELVYFSIFTESNTESFSTMDHNSCDDLV